MNHKTVTDDVVFLKLSFYFAVFQIVEYKYGVKEGDDSFLEVCKAIGCQVEPDADPPKAGPSKND